MLELNPVTLCLSLITLVCLVAMLYLWQRQRKRYLGIGWWSLYLGGKSLGYASILLREAAPAWISVFLGNFFLLLSLPALLKGTREFASREGRRAAPARLGLLDTLIIALTLGGMLWVSLSDSNPQLRYLVTAPAFVWFYARVALLLLRKPEGLNVPSFRFAGLAYALMIPVIILRAPLVLLEGPATQGLSPGNAENLIFVSLAVLVAASTLAQILMVTERTAYHLNNERERFRYTFEEAPFGILLSRMSDGRILDINRCLCRLGGFKESDAIGASTRDYDLWVNPADRESLWKRIYEGGRIENEEYSFRRRDGKEIRSLVTARKISYDGEDTLMSIVRDVTEVREQEERLRRMSTHDTLTGLPMRRYYFDLAGIAAAQASRSGRRFAVLTVDLEDFQRINETFGHVQGDCALVEAVSRIKGQLREGDSLFRLGEESFAALLADIGDQSDPLRVMARIQSVFERRFELAGIETRLTCVQGLALYPEDGESPESLLKAAKGSVNNAEKETSRDTLRG